jgi:16S rRNA (cytidine1402-2'-O)-methyltransferase
MVLLLDGTPSETTARPSLADEVKALIKSQGLTEKDSLKQAAKLRGMGKSEAYREFQRTQPRRR